MHEDVATGFIVTPNFEQVQQFLGQGTFIVVGLEELKELGRDFRSHLSYYVFVKS